jgi:hypothetical protein
MGDVDDFADVDNHKEIFHLSVMAKLGRTMEQSAIDESSLEDVVTRLLEFVNSLPCEFKTHESCVELLDVLTTRVLSNIKVRGIICGVLQSIACFDDVPHTVQEAIEDWQAKAAVQNQSASFLTQAIELSLAIADLESSKLKLDSEDDEVEVRLFLDEGEGVASVSGCLSKAKQLPVLLTALPFVKFVQSMLQGCLQVAFDDFAKALVLDALQHGPERGVEAPVAKQICCFLDCLMDKVKLGEMAKITVRVFATSGKKEQQWPCESLHALFLQLLDVMPEKVFVLSLAILCRESVDAPVWTSKDHCKAVCRVFKGMSVVMASLSYLRVKIFSEAEPCVKEHRLKAEVSTAMSFVKSTVNVTLSEIGAVAQLPQFQAAPWSSSVAQCKRWLLLVKEQLPQMCRCLLLQCLESTLALALEVQKVTPRFDHILSDKAFNRGLAKKHLLAWPSRAVLSEKTILLFNSLADLSRLHTQWALTPGLQEDLATKEAVDTSESLFATAKTAITVIAAVNVVLELTGTEQAEQARTLVDSKGKSLPAMLVQALEKVSSASAAKAK